MKSFDIRSAYKATVHYIDIRLLEFTLEQKDVADELKRRIMRLENDYNRLIHINNLLCEAELPKSHFDETTGIITATYKGATSSFRLISANPNTPVKAVGRFGTGAYTPNDIDKMIGSEELDNLKMDMEQLLENFYNNAFRTTKLIQVLTGKTKYHCSEITMVRNRLIEHPEIGSIYSFGFSTNGPVVKPIQRGEKTWVDNGLIPNTHALVASLIEALSLKDK